MGKKGWKSKTRDQQQRIEDERKAREADAARLLQEAENKAAVEERETEERAKTVHGLHLMQVSLQGSDTKADLRKDLDYAFAQSPDVIGLTEVGTNTDKSIVKKRAREAGYEPLVYNSGSSHLLVRHNAEAGMGITSADALKVSSGPDRYIAWGTFMWWGVPLCVHVAQWSRLTNPHRHSDITVAMSRLVQEHGQSHLSFFMGDLNIKDSDEGVNAPNLIFKSNGLVTIWDEFNVVPKKRGDSAYDIVGSYRPHFQVSGEKWKIWPKTRSDHSFVSAWYLVDVLEPLKPEWVDPDFYATGGDVDWTDYTSMSDTYPLHVAHGDSVTHRHSARQIPVQAKDPNSAIVKIKRAVPRRLK